MASEGRLLVPVLVLVLGQIVTQNCEEGPPSAPLNSSAVIVGSKVTLSWLPPLDPGGRDDLFSGVSCDMCPWTEGHCRPCGRSLAAEPRWEGLLDPRLTIEGLQHFTNCTFRIQARNGVSGMAEVERGVSLLPVLVVVGEGEGAPPTVAQVTVLRREETSLSVAWQPPRRPGPGIMGYEVMYQQQGDERFYTVQKLRDNEVTIGQLRPATVYLLRVRVQTPLGPGAYSPVYRFQTLPPESKRSHIQIIVSCVAVSLALVFMLALLNWVRQRDLKSMGVSLPGHQRRILDSIQGLKE